MPMPYSMRITLTPEQARNKRVDRQPALKKAIAAIDKLNTVGSIVNNYNIPKSMY